MINTKSYCSLSTSGWDSRAGNMCCLVDLPQFKNFHQMHDNKDVQRLVSDLGKGIRNSRCQQCWDFESVGAKSMRQQFLQYQKTLESYESESKNKKIRHLVISTGSQCNFACRTCNPSASTGHEKEYELLYGKPYTEPKLPATDMKLLEEDLSNVISIEVLGGEPFTNLQHLEIVKHIGNLPTAKSCSLNYVTNGSVRLRAEIVDNFKNFKDVNICLSIDAVGKAFEYIRTLGKWDRVKENIDQLIVLKNEMKNLNIIAHPTIGALNILILDDLFRYFRNKGIEYYIGFCDSPKHYSLNIFDQDQKTAIIQKLSRTEHPKIDQVISKMKKSTFKDEYLDAFGKAVKFTRDYRKLNLGDYLPELQQMINCP